MRLAWWAVALSVGIVVGTLTGSAASGAWTAIGLCSASLALLGLLLAWRWRAMHLAWAVGAVCIGGVLGYREVLRATGPPSFGENVEVVVLGEVVAGADVAPESASLAAEPADPSEGAREDGGARCHLRIHVDRIDGLARDIVLSLLVLRGIPDVVPGDVIEFAARLFVPRGFANPELPDARLLARAQGTQALATVRSPDALRVVARRCGLVSGPRRWAFFARRAMAAAINRHVNEPAAGFIRTMVLGERSDVPTQVEDGFRAAGATHVLSVSGLHLAVVVALVFHVLRRAFAAIPALALRVPAKVAASALSLPACAFYALLTGEAVATLRSALMAAIVLLASLVNRPLCLAASIAAAALVLLVRSPLSILDVSFELSFASVIGLGLFARWLLPARAQTRAGLRHRLVSWLVLSLSASFAACLVTAPLVAHHFGEMTPAAPVGNLVLVPMVELVVLPCGLAGALLALVHPWLGALPLGLAAWAARAALAAADLFRRFAPVVLVRYPTWTETLLLMAGAGLLLGALLRRSGGPCRRWFIASLVTGGLALTSIGLRDVLRTSRDDLRVTFVDVGQGDAAIVEGPQGFVALIDAGGRYDDGFDTGARIVEPVLRTRGIAALDLVILSHPHPDHMNGLFRILERFPVGALWTHGDDGHNRRYGELIALAHRRGVRVVSPTEQILRGGLSLVPLGPWLDGRIAVPPGLGTNDGSLVVQIVFAGRNILFSGDIGSEGEEELFDACVALPSDILKVPHHGSRYASSERFLAAVSPSLAVASAGRFNRFGLPNPAAMERYEGRGIRFLRTDRNGAVDIRIDRRGRIGTACALGCQR